MTCNPRKEGNMVLWNVEGNVNDKCMYCKNRKWNLWVRSGGGRAGRVVWRGKDRGVVWRGKAQGVV